MRLFSNDTIWLYRVGLLVSFYFVGGLNDAINLVISLAQEQGIPCVFALGRKALGRVCLKKVPVSCVGVFNYDGSEVLDFAFSFLKKIL